MPRTSCSLLPRPKRKKVRDTWSLIDAKLGAYVRGQFVLIVLVGTVLSLVFWAIGLPYWLLLGAFAGVVEIVPVDRPAPRGALAVGAGLPVSLVTALAAGLAVLVVRLFEDYLVIPRVLGDAVELTPLRSSSPSPPAASSSAASPSSSRSRSRRSSRR